MATLKWSPIAHINFGPNLRRRNTRWGKDGDNQFSVVMNPFRYYIRYLPCGGPSTVLSHFFGRGIKVLDKPCWRHSENPIL